MVHRSSSAYLSSYVCHQPAQKLKNRPDRPPGAIIDDLEPQVEVQTSVQALDTLFGCIETCWCDSSWVFVHNCVKLYGVVSLGGSTYSFWEVKFTYMRKDWGNDRPITVATHHHHSDMIYDWEITKSFAGFLQYLVIRWVPEYFVEVDAGFLATVTHNTAMIIKRRGYTTTAWKGHRKMSFNIFYRLQKSPFVFSNGVGVCQV